MFFNATLLRPSLCASSVQTLYKQRFASPPSPPFFSLNHWRSRPQLHVLRSRRYRFPPPCEHKGGSGRGFALQHSAIRCPAAEPAPKISRAAGGARPEKELFWGPVTHKRGILGSAEGPSPRPARAPFGVNCRIFGSEPRCWFFFAKQCETAKLLGDSKKKKKKRNRFLLVYCWFCCNFLGAKSRYGRAPCVLVRVPDVYLGRGTRLSAPPPDGKGAELL